MSGVGGLKTMDEITVDNLQVAEISEHESVAPVTRSYLVLHTGVDTQSHQVLTHIQVAFCRGRVKGRVTILSIRTQRMKI
jgi:galactokinase/mevalonate kinase-like predicted kinase